MEEEEKPCISDTVEDNKEIVRQFIDKEGIVWDRENFLDDSDVNANAEMSRDLEEKDAKVEIPYDYSKDVKNEAETNHESMKEYKPETQQPWINSGTFEFNMFDPILEVKVEAQQEETKYNCEFCEYSSPIEKHLKFHLSTQHSLESVQKKYKCRHCDYIGMYPSHLKIHLKKRHWKEKMCECEFCQSASKEIQLQYTSVRSKETFNCEMCEFIAFTRKNLVRHFNRIHLGKHRRYCTFCGYSTNAESALKIHMRAKHMSESSSRVYRCASCEFQSLYRPSVLKHFKRVHSAKGTEYENE